VKGHLRVALSAAQVRAITQWSQAQAARGKLIGQA
jgi:hypothetical protein